MASSVLIRREVGGTRERLRRGPVAGSILGALRRLLQRADGFLVGLEDRRREMPGSAVRVLLVIRQCVRKRTMDGQTLVRRRRLVDR